MTAAEWKTALASALAAREKLIRLLPTLARPIGERACRGPPSGPPSPSATPPAIPGQS